MNQTQLTHWESAKIGLLLSVGLGILLLIVMPDSRNFTIFGVNAIIIAILFGVSGALSSRLISKTKMGAWLGAGITLLLLFWWLYTIATNVILD